MKTKDQTTHINLDYFQNLTGEIPKPQRDGTQGIGGRIQKIRTQKGLQIHELSNLTGFDMDLLTKIESNQIQPKLGTIMKLSKALDSAFTRIISGEGDKFYSITRKNDQKTIFRSTSQKTRKALYSYKSLAPEVKGRHMETLIVQLEKNPEKIMSKHEGEEFIYVLEGLVEVTIGEDSFDLAPGDSVYYLSTISHSITSKGEKATVLAVIYAGS